MSFSCHQSCGSSGSDFSDVFVAGEVAAMAVMPALIIIVVIVLVISQVGVVVEVGQPVVYVAGILLDCEVAVVVEAEVSAVLPTPHISLRLILFQF